LQRIHGEIRACEKHLPKNSEFPLKLQFFALPLHEENALACCLKCKKWALAGGLQTLSDAQYIAH
jgi:hypothetical protein